MSDKVDLIKKLADNKPPSQASNLGTNNRKKYLFIAIGVACLLLLVYFFTTTITEPTKKIPNHTPATPVEKAEITVSPSSNTIISASGYVTARRVATIAAEITGKIDAIYFEEGQLVQKDELLAQLDSTLAVTEKESAVAQLVSKMAQVNSLSEKQKKAKFSADSKSKLFKAKVISEEVYVQAQAEVGSINAELSKAKNDVKVAKIEIERRNELVDRHFLKAPFTGIVTSKDANPGEVISPISGGGGSTRTGIATIVDMDSLEVEVDINEANINKVKKEQSVTITLDAYPEQSFPGKVIAIIPTANRDKATIKVRIGFLEKSDIIYPNMAVKVDFFSN